MSAPHSAATSLSLSASAHRPSESRMSPASARTLRLSAADASEPRR